MRNPELFSAKECCERLNISRPTLSRLVAKGLISFYRVGLKIMFSEAHLAAYLQSVEGNKRYPHSQNNNSMGEANGTV